MRKTKLIFYLLLLGFSSLSAQGGLQYLQSSESRALGGNQAAAFGLQSLFGNPAGLTKVRSLSAIATAETRYAGSGILMGGAGVAIPNKAGVFGINVGYFGIPEYNEQLLSLGYSRLLFESFAISVQARLLNFSIEEYGSQFTFSGILGMQIYLNDAITVGTYIENPVQVELAQDQHLPTIISIGGQYKFPEKLKFLISLEKDLDHKPSIQFGIEYQPVEKLSIRVGIHSEPEEISFGAAFQISDQLRLDASAAYHQVLGVSPGFSLVYQKK